MGKERKKLFVFDTSTGEYSDWSPSVTFYHLKPTIAYCINGALKNIYERAGIKYNSEQRRYLYEPSMPYTVEMIKAFFNDWGLILFGGEEDYGDIDLEKIQELHNKIFDHKEKKTNKYVSGLEVFLVQKTIGEALRFIQKHTIDELINLIKGMGFEEVLTWKSPIVFFSSSSASSTIEGTI